MNKELSDYYESEAWRKTKDRYKKSGKPQTCLVCNSRLYCLHHLSYKNLGHENLDDLMPLCINHHHELHEVLQELVWPLSLSYQVVDILKNKQEIKNRNFPVQNNYIGENAEYIQNQIKSFEYFITEIEKYCKSNNIKIFKYFNNSKYKPDELAFYCSDKNQFTSISYDINKCEIKYYNMTFKIQNARELINTLRDAIRIIK